MVYIVIFSFSLSYPSKQHLHFGLDAKADCNQYLGELVVNDLGPSDGGSKDNLTDIILLQIF